MEVTQTSETSEQRHEGEVWRDVGTWCLLRAIKLPLCSCQWWLEGFCCFEVGFPSIPGSNPSAYKGYVHAAGSLEMVLGSG
jgi:hypothetical protein